MDSMDRAAGWGLGGSRCFGSKGTQPIAGALTWDRAYIELMSPLPGVMGTGRVLDADEASPPGAVDDDEGLD